MSRVVLVTMHDGRRRELGAALGAMGVELVVAADYGEAMAVLGGPRPDVVVLDMLSPLEARPTLQEFHGWLREQQRAFGFGVVYLATKGVRWQSRYGPLLGPQVRKPVAARDLVEAVAKLLPPEVPAGASLDMRSGYLATPEGKVYLTPLEAELLAYLTRYPERPVGSVELLREVWGYAVPAGASTLARAHMSNLRAKLAVAGLDGLVVTHVGRGYRCMVSLPVVGR